MAKVYWAARDLSSFFMGNHQFILVFLAPSESMLKLQTQEVGSKRFVTLAGHQPDGNLIYSPNQIDDLKSVKETINKSLQGNFQDFDLEKHYISPPTGGGWSFATQLEQLALNYEKNTKENPVDYDLWDRNCSTWINTLLKVAGVSSAVRKDKGEFHGIDWGEEDLLDENLFK